MTSRILLITGGQIERHHYPEATQKLQLTLEEAGHQVDTANDPSAALLLRSGKYDATVVFTDGDFFNDEALGAILQFVRNGGGFVGLHTVANTNPRHPEFLKMIGVKVASGAIEPHQVYVADTSHALAQGLDTFVINDELYTFQDLSPYHVVLTTQYNNTTHPIALARNEGQGKVVYLTNGHALAGIEHPMWKRLLANSVKFVMG